MAEAATLRQRTRGTRSTSHSANLPKRRPRKSIDWPFVAMTAVAALIVIALALALIVAIH
jgi:hypothetical protein